MDVSAIAVAGSWWRQTPHGGDPIYRADPPSDGRWQRGETVGGLYLADSEETAWMGSAARRGPRRTASASAHADLPILAKLTCALSRARVDPLAA